MYAFLGFSRLAAHGCSATRADSHAGLSPDRAGAPDARVHPSWRSGAPPAPSRRKVDRSRTCGPAAPAARRTRIQVHAAPLPPAPPPPADPGPGRLAPPWSWEGPRMRTAG